MISVIVVSITKASYVYPNVIAHKEEENRENWSHPFRLLKEDENVI